MAASTPKATFNNSVHTYHFESEVVTFTLDRFDQGRDGAINCEMEVTGHGGMIRPAMRVNLLAERTITSLAKSLGERTKDQGLDWEAMLGIVTNASVKRYRSGDAEVDLTEVTGWRERPRYLLWPFIESSGDTILFADGGSGKSTVAMLIAVMVATGSELLPQTRIYATGPVLYLDYEADEITHAERLTAICNGVEPALQIPKGAIIYKRMFAPLHESVDDLIKLIAKYGVTMVVVDSLGRARGGAPEGSDETLRAFNALARLQVPRLLIDHLSKDAIFNGRGHSRPIGSIYTHNNARLTWSLTAADSHLDDSLDDGFHSIQLINHKNNNGKLQGRRTYSITYYNDNEQRLTGLYVSPLDPSTVPDFMKLQPLWKRCRSMIQEQGPATSEQLAEWLGAKKSEVERALVAQPNDFWRDNQQGGTYWQLQAETANVQQQAELQWFDENAPRTETPGQW